MELGSASCLPSFKPQRVQVSTSSLSPVLLGFCGDLLKHEQPWRNVIGHNGLKGVDWEGNPARPVGSDSSRLFLGMGQGPF